MNTQWFLGANSGSGFVSRFPQLLDDPDIRTLILLKGGPGCGKSTFMKKLRKTAAGLGADTESYPCASDPTSLDGLYLPSIGFAVLDATAPHVLEPKLCGCDAVYLNFGCFYDAEGVAAQKARLAPLYERYRCIYPAAYAHLNAASALTRCARELMVQGNPEGLRAVAGLLRQHIPPAKTGHGRRREVFVRAYTPEGEVSLHDSLLSGCRTCVALEDPCGLSAPLLSQLQAAYRDAGYDCIAIASPLCPSLQEGLAVPEAGTAFLACAAPSKAFSVTVQLSCHFRENEETIRLLADADAHCAQAVAQLRQAKALHDEIEQSYHPYVSFEGLDLLTQEYRKQVKARLLDLKSS